MTKEEALIALDCITSAINNFARGLDETNPFMEINTETGFKGKAALVDPS